MFDNYFLKVKEKKTKKFEKSWKMLKNVEKEIFEKFLNILKWKDVEKTNFGKKLKKKKKKN